MMGKPLDGSILAKIAAAQQSIRHGGGMIYLRSLAGLLLMLVALSRPAVAGESLRAGVASMITPVSTVKYYQQVVEYLGRKLGMPAEMIHRTTYDEIDVLLEAGRLDVAFICSSPYVLDKARFGAELLVAPQVNGTVFYNSNIIVHKDSPITDIEGLRGKTFVFADPKSNTGRLYPAYLLVRHPPRQPAGVPQLRLSGHRRQKDHQRRI